MNEDIKKLMRFLKERNLFNKYVNEVKRAEIPSLTATLEFNEGGPEDLLLYSFYWDRTEDGAEFWEKVDYEWSQYIKNGK